jgi:hypothetical protein
MKDVNFPQTTQQHRLMNGLGCLGATRDARRELLPYATKECTDAESCRGDAPHAAALAAGGDGANQPPGQSPAFFRHRRNIATECGQGLEQLLEQHTKHRRAGAYAEPVREQAARHGGRRRKIEHAETLMTGRCGTATSAAASSVVVVPFGTSCCSVAL